MPASARLAIGHRQVWAIAGPIIIANLSLPLLGMVDTAVVGHLAHAYFIGAVATGAMVFNFVFWGFGFLRMGTTGFVSQAFGAGQKDEIVATLIRALILAGLLGLLAVALQGLIIAFAFAVIEASAEVEALGSLYLRIRLLAAPAALANFALIGWFIGLRNTRATLLLQVTVNLTNIALDLLFVLGLGMDVAGVAAASVIAEYAGLGLAVWLLRREFRRLELRWRLAGLLLGARLRRLATVNLDIFLRTMFFSAVMVLFVGAGAKSGDVVLAANAVLMNLVSVIAFGLDGFAHAAEAFVGAAFGQRDRAAIRQAVRISTLWALATALGFVGFFWFAHEPLIAILTGIEAVRANAALYAPWLILAPLTAVWGFQLDGIFIGATRTGDMRNGAIAAFFVFLLAAWALQPGLGNHGLWLAMHLWWLARALTLGLRYWALERAALAR